MLCTLSADGCTAHVPDFPKVTAQAPTLDAALRESALPTLLTYTGHEGILSDTTQAETIAAVESLPDGRVVLEPFAEGNHNYLSEDAATAAALDKALRETTVAFLVEFLK